MAGERIAHIAARLNVDLMLGVFRHLQVRIQFERAGAGLVGLFHLGEIVVGLAMVVLKQSVPGQLLGGDAQA